MKKIIVVGAGATAKEVVSLIERQNRAGADWQIMGLLCDDIHALDGSDYRYNIIGTIKDYIPADDEQFALAIAMPKAKVRLVPGLLERGFKFVTLIDPSVEVPETTTIGEGTIVSGYTIGEDCRIGNFVNILGSMIGLNSTIGDYSTTTGYTNVASAFIGSRVFIGSHAVILNNIKVGDDTTIGAGCVIYRNIGVGKVAFCSRPNIVDDPDC